MRIVFMGSPEFAVPSLVEVANSGNKLVAVVTGEDKRRGRGNTLSPTPVKAKAIELGLDVHSFESMKDEALNQLLINLKPDLIIIVAFKILPISILEIPTIGSVNIHASLLPKYRGAAPIHWAVVNGDKETGISIFFLNEQVDAGKLILQEKIEILPTENTGDVYQKLMELGASSITKAINLIKADSFVPITQDESKVCPAPKVFPELAHIQFDKPAQDIHNWIRGMNPSPGSWVLLDGKKMKLKSTLPHPELQSAKGQIELVDSKVIIGCETGSLELVEVQLEGKSAVDAISFWNGYRGEKLLS